MNEFILENNEFILKKRPLWATYESYAGWRGAQEKRR